jgi:hypothetical protein
MRASGRAIVQLEFQLTPGIGADLKIGVPGGGDRAGAGMSVRVPQACDFRESSLLRFADHRDERHGVFDVPVELAEDILFNDDEFLPRLSHRGHEAAAGA